jgi:DNA-binding FrmR family transcriptional regulator
MSAAARRSQRLTADTIPGYGTEVHESHASHKGQLERLKRIEGQVKGVVRMVEEERYCVEILTQIRAARAALRRVEQTILREHVEHCVTQAVASGDSRERQAKLDELVTVVGRFSE